MTMVQWSLLLLGVVLSAAGGILLKTGSIQVPHDQGIASAIGHVIFNWKIILGMLMYFIPVMIWIYLLKRIELSFLQPLFSLVYVMTPVFATVFLGENITVTRWLGIGVVMAGVVVIARS